MSNREILVLDDFTEASNRALATAGHWLTPLDAQLAVIHVSDDEQAREQIGQKLRERAATHVPDHPAKALVGSGNLFHAIREGYLREHPSLLVFCTHGVHGLRQLLFGANSTHVVDETKCPTLVIQETSPAQLPVRWLVCGNSKWDDISLHQLAKLSQALKATCTLQRISLDGAELTAAEVTELHRWEDSLRQNGAECRSETSLREGFGAGLAHQIYNEAVNTGSDLIVMSRNGYPVLGKAAYDADRESLINNPSGIPVLFI